ncbi:MAG: hypothetical protein IJW70_06105 [Clostridia bacterium]|nr:hypothetical protein [Clostridia bacterium]
MISRPVRIAFLIVTHANPEQLNLFIRQLLTYQHCDIYVHTDAKNPGMIEKILQSDRVIILPEHHDVRWGDYSQILVNNYLLGYAAEHGEYDYFSLHSGADLAIRPVREFADYLQSTAHYAYYEAAKLPTAWQYGGGLGRVALHWPKCFRRRLSRYSPMRYARSLYGRLYGCGIIKGKKLPEQYPLYGGADWFTISHDCVRDVVHFLEQHRGFDEMFVHSLSGAEIYYVTLFEMLKGARSTQSNNMLRYVDWKERGQRLPVGAPNYCAMSFLQEIEASGRFFARKFDENYDSAIIAYFINKTTNAS